MFIVNKESKVSKELKEANFSDFGLKERQDLQEWIANNPSMLGEELLIIQKEFHDFDGTNERLDLLALDKDGNLVIIENKLDDSGTDVVWQAFKYAGYCSILTNQEIIKIYQQYLDKLASKNQTEPADAQTKILDFLNITDIGELQLNKDITQRIILVAREFRKEVTHTVIWARKFGMNIQCIKMLPFNINDTLVVDVDQIIPVNDIKDIMIGYEIKNVEDSNSNAYRTACDIIRTEFWHRLLPEFNKKSDLFSGRNMNSGSDNHWFSTGAGIASCTYSFYITNKYCSVSFEAGSKDVDFNKNIFDYLYKHKNEIEDTFGDKLIWDRRDEKKSTGISYKLDTVGLLNKDDWDLMISFLIKNMINLDKSLKKFINEYKK